MSFNVSHPALSHPRSTYLSFVYFKLNCATIRRIFNVRLFIVHPLQNLLITGGAGFIGANFIHYWQKHYPHSSLVNVDALTYAGNLQNLAHLPHPDRYHFVEGDIGNQALIEKLLREQAIDTIVHFAAESHVDQSIKNPAVFVQTNVMGTYSMLEAARKVWLQEKKWDASHCRFHHISTDEVYGTLGPHDPPFNEAHPYAPNSPYSASKAGSDHLVRAYHHTYGLPVSTSNCSNNYGPFQHAEKFIPTIIRACQNQQPIPVYGNGSNIRDWLYVEDHCAAIDCILRKGTNGEVYNIGGDNEYSNLKLVSLICDVFDEIRPTSKSHHTLIEFVKDRPGHDWRYAIDGEKIRKELGWKPKAAFLETLRTYIRESIAT